MAVRPYESGSVTALPGLHSVAIERLPARRISNNEPRESMNCKSYRCRTGSRGLIQLQIKCNRLRPACEACQVFQCPCIYDAVPKKRGPKTDVLEALLKRVDGLEARLKEKKTDPDMPTSESTADDTGDGLPVASTSETQVEDASDIPLLDAPPRPGLADEAVLFSPTKTDETGGTVKPDALLDTYFSRFHAKPFHVVDESTLRQRLQLNKVPPYLIHAIYAVAAKYTPHPNGYQSAVKLSEDYAAQSRAEIDTDEPSVDALQALMLLVISFTAAGRGKKAYMLLANAVGMAMTLELHRELDANSRVTPFERELRRRLFWSCFLLDKFMACGSKRPSLVADNTILLRLPCWAPNSVSMPIDGDFFQSSSNLQYMQGAVKRNQGSNGMLIDICRILGATNRYLAAGGVKGDSHFPWHSLSNLSKIRQELDIWASGTAEVFSSLEALFGQPDSTILVLNKLIYHLIHCLIYRPFLPIDLAELSGTGQHQSWQIEATNMCFLHANAIAELVELGKQAASIEWPAFVGYCICTAGTVHIHGAHYTRNSNAGEMSVFSNSANFLSREMHQLSELRYAWASVQHQQETLQAIFHAHSGLVKSLTNNSMRYSPVFQLEDFFDRYSKIDGGQTFSFDSANLSLSDVIVDFTADSYTGHDLYAPRLRGNDITAGRSSLKRKNTAPLGRRRPSLVNTLHLPSSPSLPTPSRSRYQSLPTPSMGSQMSPGILQSPTSAKSHHGFHAQNAQRGIMHGAIDESMTTSDSVTTSTLSGFPHSARPHNQNSVAGQGTSSQNGAIFDSTFSFSQLRPASPGPGETQEYDPMFGGVPTNAFSSPAPWQGDEGGGAKVGTAVSPGSRSRDESSGTAQNDEKDPFLSLLEQLAENESAMGTGSELDFFLAGAPSGS
ncbi:fungal-specific transcription factor domain-containing protein [Immersiella caudata]|uniref:Fungal-specific transcription factor domain-containing protein n=1 Tax=Immersiella caudata TaxID=314043 RepID=A0AA40C611_9PEZI|nr:fungal-specific transcription factor domain-containing protein [Immersiella caudata]